MKRMLFNATQAEELRVAIVDGQKLVDLDIETVGKEQRKGNIYKGVITRIEPSLEACFVDYGTERHGFLPFKEVSRSYFQGYEGGRPRIQEVLREGMEVVIQVEKDERGNKGAALTTYISLAGRYVVLMPNNPRGGGVSRRIEGEERQELKELMSQLDVPSGMSLIARTAGIGRVLEELQWDLNYLLQLWQAIENAAGAQAAPFLILQESSLVFRAIRDYYQPDIGEVLVDTEEIFEQARDFMSHVMPNNASRIKRYTDHVPLFSRFQIEHQIETAFARSVQLPSGGAIVIDHTEALVSIDVNSARATKGADIEETAFKTNLEAAEEIARQLRLRDLGGLIVIDFIDMEAAKNQREVEVTLREAIKHDRARVQLGKLSRFGLLELSRQRLQPSLGESSHIVCPRCHGVGYIRGTESSALHILRVIQEEALKENTGAVHAQVPVDVATFLLNEKRTELYGLEDRLDVSILLIPNIHLETPSFNVTRVRNDDMDEVGDAPSYRRVEQPEVEDISEIEKTKTKVERPEAAVKGISIQRAPIVQSEGFLSKILAWFKGSEEEPVPAKQARSNSRERRENNGQPQRNGERRQSNQRRERGEKQGENGRGNNRRHSNNDNRNNISEEASEQRQERRRDREPKENQNRQRNSRDSGVSTTTQNEIVRAPKSTKPASDNGAGAEAPVERNDRRRRRARRDRKSGEEVQPVGSGVAVVAETTKSAEIRLNNEPPVNNVEPVLEKSVQMTVPGEKEVEPVRLLVKPEKTVIQKVEEAVEITRVVETVTPDIPVQADELAVAEQQTKHIVPDTTHNFVTTNISHTAQEIIRTETIKEPDSEVIVSSIAVIEESTINTTPLVSDIVTPASSDRVAVQSELPLDLGGLVMVSTAKVDVDTPEKIPAEVEEPKGLRRRDVTRIEAEQSSAIELVQVETRDNDNN